jgi:hypothetical protein
LITIFGDEGIVQFNPTEKKVLDKITNEKLVLCGLSVNDEENLVCVGDFSQSVEVFDLNTHTLLPEAKYSNFISS